MSRFKKLINTVLDLHDELHRIGELNEIDIDDATKSKPATDNDIRLAEERIGAALPPSYKEYLMEINGHHQLSDLYGQLFSCSEIKWFRDEHQEWIDAYQKPNGEYIPEEDISEADHLVYGADQDDCFFRLAYLSEVLQISEPYDGAVYLLNPKVVDDNDEWEAWAFATWNPGAIRYRNFQDLVNADIEGMSKRLKEFTEQEDL